MVYPSGPALNDKTHVTVVFLQQLSRCRAARHYMQEQPDSSLSFKRLQFNSKNKKRHNDNSTHVWNFYTDWTLLLETLKRREAQVPDLHIEHILQVTLYMQINFYDAANMT